MTDDVAADETVDAPPADETGDDDFDEALDDDALDTGDDDGDIDGDIDGDLADEFDDIGCAERVLEVCLRAIVDDPDAIEIDVDDRDARCTLHVRVAPDDMGKIIGKRGRVANALRTLVKAAGARDGVNASVEIDD
jgi:predicted RNA-binding protein YlqC (UPF0109 family)